MKSATNWVAEKVQPVVKAVADYASYIPVIGAPIAGVAQQINKGIDVARGAVDTIGNWGSRIGGAIDRIMPQPARSFSRPM